jgi:hypothetical protein
MKPQKRVTDAVEQAPDILVLYVEPGPAIAKTQSTN